MCSSCVASEKFAHIGGCVATFSLPASYSKWALRPWIDESRIGPIGGFRDFCVTRCFLYDLLLLSFVFGKNWHQILWNGCQEFEVLGKLFEIVKLNSLILRGPIASIIMDFHFFRSQELPERIQNLHLNVFGDSRPAKLFRSFGVLSNGCCALGLLLCF